MQLESEKHEADRVTQELSKLRSAFECGKGVFDVALHISSELSTIMTRLGSRLTLRKFPRGDTLAALNWCVSTLDMLPQAIRTFAGFSCATGARVVGASIEHKCNHIAEAMKKDYKLCTTEELGNISEVVKKLGRRVYCLLW